MGGFWIAQAEKRKEQAFLNERTVIHKQDFLFGGVHDCLHLCIMTTTIYLVRHGETEENRLQILQGHLPGHLTPLGRQQAEACAQQLENMHLAFDCILYSDLLRTHDTAEIINSHLHLPLYPCPLLRERDWGSFTGMPVIRAQKESIPDDAESVEAMFRRARLFLKFIKNRYEGKTILAVGHGLFNRTIQAALQGVEIRDIPRMENAEVRCCRFETLPDEWGNKADMVSAD